MKLRTLVFTGFVIAAFASSANAQYTISKSVIGAGGGPVSGGSYTMNGTIGQPVIGPTSGGTFQVNQGFWYTVSGPSSVTPRPGNPTGYELAQNFPNPFNPSTKIRFSLPERTSVTLRVMNLLGEEVARIIDGETYDAGNWEADFVAEGIPSGTYVYRLEAGGQSFTKKMVLTK
jgi:hypothetical protein